MALRDVELAQLEQAFSTGCMDEVAMRRAQHVISENLRCQKACNAFKAREFETVGKLMHESHVSLRNDYEVSCTELDALVDTAMAQTGVLGSRMTGAGFGGCVISLVEADKLEEVKAALSKEYMAKFGKDCVHFSAEPSAGARRVDMALYFPDQHGYECIVQATIWKALGNNLFKKGDPKSALQKYNRIPLAIKGLIKKGDSGGGMGMMGMPNNKDEEALDDEQRDEVKALWHTCHINRAMCYIKLEEWEKVRS